MSTVVKQGILHSSPSTPLFGAAALTAIAAATALALAERKRRKDEEARQAAEAQRKAAARNAAEALQRIQNWLIGQQIKKAQEETSTRPPLYPDPETADMTESERLAQYKQSAAYQARQERYRQWEMQQAYQSYRAGERTEYTVRQERNETEKSGTKDIPTWRKTLSKLASIGALTLDITSLAISSSGALLETIFTALGLAEPTPGGGEMMGFGVGVALYNTVLNPIENRLSISSALLVTVSDILVGNTRFEQAIPFSGIHATELVIGQDTLVAWGGIAFGNTPLTPEAFTDTAVNAGIVYYDVQRLREHIPDYVSCRIGRTESGTLYFRCLSSGDE